MKHVLLTVPLVLLACADADARNSAGAESAVAAVPQSPGTRVEIATLGVSDAQLRMLLPGEVSGSRDALLASSTGGFVEAVLATKGQEVRKGQAIARVNSSLMKAQSEQAHAQAELAEAEAKRVEDLGDLASASQLLTAQTQARVARTNADISDIQLRRSVITAPFAGTIAQMDLEVGEVINPASPIARLVKLDPIFVTVSVSDRDVLSLKPGQSVAVSADAASGLHFGTIRAVDPAADLSTRTFIAEIEVPNPDRLLLPGMIATATLEANAGADQMVIPQDWLVTSLQGIGVYVEQDGAARWRPVVPGAIVHDQVVVQSGLNAGDRLVTVGHRDLADGDPLIIAREGHCCVSGRVTYP